MIKNLSSYFKYIILYFKYNILITIGIKFIILDNYSYCHCGKACGYPFKIANTSSPFYEYVATFIKLMTYY